MPYFDYQGKQIYYSETGSGALAAMNFAMEHASRVKALICDSFEGIAADAAVTQTLAAGRSCAKQAKGFRNLLKMMHSDDWEAVFDADTDAVIRHAAEVVNFFHQPIASIKAPILLTGSAEDKMFPQGHYEKLFSQIKSGALCNRRGFSAGKANLPLPFVCGAARE